MNIVFREVDPFNCWIWIKFFEIPTEAEKNYLDDFIRYGAEHPKSQKTKELIDQAVDNFEQTTGITWPFKDEE